MTDLVHGIVFGLGVGLIFGYTMGFIVRGLMER